MITMTRSLARELRAVFRRAGIRRNGHSARVSFLAAADTLRVRLRTEYLALEYCLPGRFQPEQLTVPFEFLADCEGRKDEPVTLQTQANGRTLVGWSDRGVPQMVQYEADPFGQVLEFPVLPNQLQALEPKLWPGLADAADVAERDRIRYAFDCLQLRGASGQVAATNGRHVLLQGGFNFPWQDEVLVPASGVLGCPELASQREFNLGKTDDCVALIAGPWSVFLKIEKVARFPKVDDLLRPSDQACTRLQLEPSDARFLANALPRLPGGEDTHYAVTLDLNGRVVIRAADEEQTRVTELMLTNSRSTGEPIVVNTNRNFLLRAVRLGFHDICLYGQQVAIQCNDGQRQYLWAVLDSQGALQSGDDPIRLASPAATGPAATLALPTRKKRSTMPKTTSTQTESQADQAIPLAAEPSEADKTAGPIEQALALRTALRETLVRTNDLITALKRQKRQSKLVQSTLAALEELRSAG